MSAAPRGAHGGNGGTGCGLVCDERGRCMVTRAGPLRQCGLHEIGRGSDGGITRCRRNNYPLLIAIAVRFALRHSLLCHYMYTNLFSWMAFRACPPNVGNQCFSSLNSTRQTDPGRAQFAFHRNFCSCMLDTTLEHSLQRALEKGGTGASMERSRPARP